MIDFNRDSLFNLVKLDSGKINKNIPLLLIEGEEIIDSYRTVRDQIIFTDKRIISLNVKGVTGRKKEYCTIPYSKIQFYSIQTKGFLELFPDAELTIFFANGHLAVFEFKGDNDILSIGKLIAKYTLEK